MNSAPRRSHPSPAVSQHARFAPILLLVAIAATVRGANVTWTPAAGSLDWFSATNWNPNGLPQPTDVVTIGLSGATIQGVSLATANSLSILSGGSVTVGDVSAGTVNIGGQLNVAAGRLSLNFGALTLNSLAIGTAGSYADTRAGTMNLAGSNPTIQLGTLTVVMNSQLIGTTGLALSGPGTLALNNNNSYTGGTTISPLSTLVVGNGATTGSLGSGEVKNSGTLIFGRSDSTTITNTISGTGNVTQAGTGTTILGVDNSFSGSTTVTSGVLQVGSGGRAGSLGGGGINDNATLIFNRSDDITLQATITGSGNLVQSGTGTLALTGNNSFSGIAVINSGTLQIGAGASDGSLAASNIVNNSSLVFKRADSLQVTAAISGTGSVSHAGSGTVILLGNNSYGGNTLVGSGTLQIGNGGIVGTVGTGNITDNGSVVFNRSDAVLVAGTISGTGSLTQAGSGLLAISGNNTLSGNIVIASGTLQVGNGAASGSLGTGTVTNNGTLIFNRSDAPQVDNRISGTGSVRQAGTGTTILTADNAYSGGTSITAGSLQFGNGGATGSPGPGNITNNGALLFNRTIDLVLNASVSGTGGLGQLGNSTLTVTGNSTYTGGTLLSAGTLQVGNGGTSGSLGSGPVSDNGTLVFNRSDSFSQTGTISGTGNVTHAGNGTLTLSGNNTYGGITTIGSGTLQIGVGGVTGSLGTGAVLNNGNLTFNRADTVVVPNIVSGVGGLRQSGPGTTILTSNNTYAGSTTISGGTLQVGAGGIAGTIGAGDVANNGVLQFARSDSITFPNNVSGVGSVVQNGAGTLILTGNNSYSGATLVNAGAIQIGAGGTVGTIGSGDIVNNGRLVMNRSDNVTLSAAVSGNGTLVQSGSGQLTVSGTNSYTGGTVVSTGTLQVGIGGSTGSIGNGPVIASGNLIFNRSDRLEVGGSISGTGSVSQVGAGTLVLSANNSYSGGTTISRGGLQIGNGGTTGSIGSGNIVNQGTLTFSRSDSISVDNVVSGSGSFVHAGTGNLSLSGNNTFSGGTAVNGGGVLRVVGANALGGGDLSLTSGTLKLDTTTAGIRPTLAIGGSYNQGANGIMELNVQGSTAGQFDQVRVANKAVVNGTLRVIGTPSYRPLHNSSLVLLSANGGVSGRFAQFENNFSYSPLLTPQLRYNANDVTLFWDHGSFVPYARTNNERAVATGLDSLASSTAAADVSLIDHLDYDFLSSLASGGLGKALAAISPEGLTAMFGTSLNILDVRGTQFLQRADEFRFDYRGIYDTALRSHAASPEAFDAYVDHPWTFYLDFPATSANYAGTIASGDYSLSTRGLALGLERRLRQGALLGFSIDYLNSKADLSGGDVTTKSVGFSAYAGWASQGWHVIGMAGVGQDSVSTNRSSLGGAAGGSTKGVSWTALGGGGYDWHRGRWQVGAQAVVQAESAGVDTFSESGSLAPLKVLSQNLSATHTQVGLNTRFSQRMQQWTIIVPQAYVGWRHDLTGNQWSVGASSTTGAGNKFVVHSPKWNSDSVIGQLGVSVQWQPAVNTSLSIGRQFGRQEARNFQLLNRIGF